MMKMTKPTMARWTVSRGILLAASALLFTACARDGSSPTGVPMARTHVSYDLAGAHDQTYTFVVNTWQNNQQFNFGNSYIQIPANAICNIATSGYGPAYWNSPCTPATGQITITATVTNSGSDHPSVQFEPALRFNPATTVTLLLAATNKATLSNMSVIDYCSAAVPTLTNASCVNEAANDPSLASTVNLWNMTISRRIKHFSGYLITDGSGDPGPSSM
jgi:hypothetical protein